MTLITGARRSIALTAAVVVCGSFGLGVAEARAGVGAGAAARPVACRPHPSSVVRLSPAKAVRTVAANMTRACGFTFSGNFLGTHFGVDGMAVISQSRYDAAGGAHVVIGDQGVVIDVYRAGGAEYVRLYEYAAPHAKPDENVRAMWNDFGVTSNAVINAAGSQKWVKLTAKERKRFDGSAGSGAIGWFGSASSLATAITAGNGTGWQAGGIVTVNGVRCVRLISPGDKQDLYPRADLYVNAATGLPAGIRFASTDGQRVMASFGSWSHPTVVRAPARVVAGLRSGGVLWDYAWRMLAIHRLHLASLQGVDGKRWPVHGFVVTHPGGAVLVDTGVGGPQAALDDWRVVNRSVAEALAELDMTPGDIDLVINTHLHFDHCGQNAVFKHAPFYVQRAEVARAQRESPELWDWFGFRDARFELLDGDAPIVPGLSVLSTPGHTAGHQCVLVSGSSGPSGRSGSSGVEVLIGDAAYTPAVYSLPSLGASLSGQAADSDAWLGSLSRVRALKPERVHFCHHTGVV